jgi:hypothetical protein
MAPNRPQTLIRLDVSVGSISEVDARNGEVCFTPMNGHRPHGRSLPKSARRRHSGRIIPILLDQDIPLSLKDPKNLSFFPATTSRYALGYSIVSM